MHFYIIDGNFYLGRWLHMPPAWQVPSSLSDLCIASIIIPYFKYQAASAVSAALPLFFLFQDAEGFAGEIWAKYVLRVENVAKFVTGKTEVNYQV